MFIDLKYNVTGIERAEACVILHFLNAPCEALEFKIMHIRGKPNACILHWVRYRDSYDLAQNPAKVVVIEKAFL